MVIVWNLSMDIVWDLTINDYNFQQFLFKLHLEIKAIVLI